MTIHKGNGILGILFGHYLLHLLRLTSEFSQAILCIGNGNSVFFPFLAAYMRLRLKKSEGIDSLTNLTFGMTIHKGNGVLGILFRHYLLHILHLAGKRCKPLLCLSYLISILFPLAATDITLTLCLFQGINGSLDLSLRMVLHRVCRREHLP